VTNAVQSASGLHAALSAASQAPEPPSPLTHASHVASAAFGVAAQSVTAHWLLQFATLQMHACAAASKVLAPDMWFVAQQLMHELPSGSIAHAASPPPPLDEAPLEPPLDVPDDPPLLLVLEPPELVDEPPDDELLVFPPPGSVAFEPVLSPGIIVVVGDVAQATSTAPRAVMGSARARCRMGGSPPIGAVCFLSKPGAQASGEKAPRWGDAPEAAVSLLLSIDA
jgi:hypothetical protein